MALVEGVFSLFKIKARLKKEKNKKHTYTIAKIGNSNGREKNVTKMININKDRSRQTQYQEERSNEWL